MKRSQHKLEAHTESGQRTSLSPSLLKHTPLKIYYTVIAILLMALLVRLYCLDKQGLECDEFFTIGAANGQHYIYFSSQSKFRPAHFPTTVEGYSRLLTPQADADLTDVTGVIRRNVHMPLYFYLMHYWTKFAGTSEWALRFPSAIFGTLAVLLIFLLGKELFSPFVGLAAALLMAFMPVQIYYSQQARMYSLLVLLVVAASRALLLARKNHSSSKYYLLYGIISVAGLYTHYVYSFCLVAQALFVLIISPPQKRYWRVWFLTFVGIAIAFLPWMLFVGADQQQTSADVTAWARAEVSATVLARQVASLITRLISVPEAPLGLLSVILAFGFMLLGIIFARSKKSNMWLLGLWVLVPIAAILTMDIALNTHAIRVPRYWIVITPALYLLIARGFEELVKDKWKSIWRLAVVVVLAVCGTFVAIKTARGELRPRPDRYRELARFIEGNVNNPDHELIMTEGTNALPLAVAYYSRSTPPHHLYILPFNWAVDPANKQQFREVMRPRTDVWLLMSGASRAGSMLENSGFHRVSGPIQFGHGLVFHYQRVISAAVLQ